MAQNPTHAPPLQHKGLYFGDCLTIMEGWSEGCVDLIYLDPPFNSNAHYNVIYGTDPATGRDAQAMGFADTWYWDTPAEERLARLRVLGPDNPLKVAADGLRLLRPRSGMLAYLTYMAERLVECHRVLKDTGSIYLHCDPTASHYLKILMDTIFGPRYFKNEVIWSYGLGGSSWRWYSRKHDVILFYTKADDYYFDKPLEPATSQRMKGELKGVRDVWDIPSINNMAKERLGYPTQKPLALLERIVAASSDTGDFVLDPFCGCGTTIEAAHNLDRQWAGIDISSFAIDLVAKRRLAPSGIQPIVVDIPKDLASARKLAKIDAFDFETWAVTRMPGMLANRRQVGDDGIDGHGYTHDKINGKQALVLAQVSASPKPSLSKVRDFCHVVERESKEYPGEVFGVFITVDEVTSDKASSEASGMGRVSVGATRYPRLQLWSINNHYAGVLPQLPALQDSFTGKQIQDSLFD